MKSKFQTIGITFLCFSMVFGIFGMMIAAAFPSTPEQDKITEDTSGAV
jgi:hypothetical protein